MKRLFTLILIAALIALTAWLNPFAAELTPREKWQLLCGALTAPNMSEADVAELIDKYHIDVNATQGVAAPIQFAVRSGDAAKVHLLISRGASATASSSGPYSLPHSAVIAGNIPVLQELLEGGCNIECGDFKQGFTLLMCAVTANQPAVAEWLLQHGAQVNYRSTQLYPDVEHDFTALHVAARLKNHRMYSLLMTHGADETLLDNHGKTARDYLEEQPSTLP